MKGCPAPFLRIALVALALWASIGTKPARAAIGCTLTNPAQDLKHLFPEMTSYREELRELHRMKDGRALHEALKERLGSDLDPIYETYETPYTVYTVFRAREVIGIVHGVNVPGQGGLIQVFLSADPRTGAIRQVFFQRLESAASRALRSRDYLAQFKDLTLADFYRHDYYRATKSGSVEDKVARIKSPVSDEKGRKDSLASLRGVRKNLILLDIFIYDRRFETVYRETQAALRKASGSGS